MPTYAIDPLHPSRLRCNDCGQTAAALSALSACGVEHLTAYQVGQLFGPEAGQAAEVHDGKCGQSEREVLDEHG
jgi:hypothetical protein